MATHQESDQRITESISVVTFDADTGQFRATFDSDRDSASLAVVEVIATVNGMNPLELTPIESVIDSTALDDLTSKSGTDGGFDSLRFRYENYQVTVRHNGAIEAIPLSCS